MTSLWGISVVLCVLGSLDADACHASAKSNLKKGTDAHSEAISRSRNQHADTSHARGEGPADMRILTAMLVDNRLCYSGSLRLIGQSI